ncbi:MAG: hypothetical protein NHB14_27200 [Desulfosporosinus sp.]|nr:hypothetical protein [Desulfosporosinus sp.]
MIPVKHEVEVKELEQLIVQTMAGSLEELHSDLVNIGSVVGEALKAQNEALRAEISVLHDTIKAIEERQKEREAAHYDLVDQRLRELKEEPKRGFWARLLGR